MLAVSEVDPVVIFVVANCDCSASIAGAAIAVVDSNPNRFRNCFLFI
jgi:hypothetical protein